MEMDLEDKAGVCGRARGDAAAVQLCVHRARRVRSNGHNGERFRVDLGGSGLETNSEAVAVGECVDTTT